VKPSHQQERTGGVPQLFCQQSSPCLDLAARVSPNSSSVLGNPTLAQAARLATAALNTDQRSQAAQTLVALAGSVESGSSDGLEGWLGPGPADPVSLELRSLMQRFDLRRQQLRRTIGADQVADLLQTSSRQTPHDRAKAGIYKYKTRASVDGQTAVEAELMCTMRKVA
jgi:hypothetical protein